MSIWSSVLGIISKPVTMWIDKSESRKYMKAEGELAITKAKVAFEVAQFQAKADRLTKNDQNDANYDMAAQAEKRYTLADEILLACTIILVSCHFIIPASMAAGWAAMGYTSAPWWLEFIIVGIYISVFGLMRLFRAWSPFGGRAKKGEKNEQIL
jgi:hypothetical protein